MLILGITTSTGRCGAALMRDGNVLGETVFPGARSCVEELIPRIAGLLEENSLKYPDVDRYAVDVGPGGMTGLKIGIVAVKTLAQVHEKPVVGVSSMRALCHGADTDCDLMFPVVKCMKREHFTAVYRRTGGDLECVEEERLDKEDVLKKRLIGLGGERVFVLGDALERVKEIVVEAIGEKAVFGEGDMNFPGAAVVCEIAREAEPAEFSKIMPNYLCLTNAERNLGIKA